MNFCEQEQTSYIKIMQCSQNMLNIGENKMIKVILSWQDFLLKIKKKEKIEQFF